MICVGGTTSGLAYAPLACGQKQQIRRITYQFASYKILKIIRLVARWQQLQAVSYKFVRTVATC